MNEPTKIIKSHYAGCMSDETCKCQDHDDQSEWEAEMKAHKIEQMHDFLGERETEEEE
jgi:hypothetical protein